jgi:hypothetical protein
VVDHTKLLRVWFCPFSLPPSRRLSFVYCDQAHNIYFDAGKAVIDAARISKAFSIFRLQITDQFYHPLWCEKLISRVDVPHISKIAKCGWNVITQLSHSWWRMANGLSIPGIEWFIKSTFF